MSFADRFEQALKKAKSIRAFHEEISNSEKWGSVPGSSYSMIHRYLRGKATPPVEFIETAAEILGVRAAWLRTGEGGPTEEEELARRGQTRAEDDRDRAEDELLEEVEAIVRRIFPLYDNFPGYVQTMIWSTMGLIATEVREREVRDGTHPGGDDALRKASEIVAKSLYTPMSLVPPSLIDPDRFALYGVAICEALMHAISPFPAEERASRLKQAGSEEPGA